MNAAQRGLRLAAASLAVAVAARAGSVTLSWGSTPSAVAVNQSYTVAGSVYWQDAPGIGYCVLALMRNTTQIGGGNGTPNTTISASSAQKDTDDQVVTYKLTATPYDGSATTSTHVVTVGDVVAPSVPKSLSADQSTTSNGFTLHWAASTDVVGVTGYEVMRGTTSLGTTSSTSKTLTGLTQGATYAMKVRARDAAGNWSGWSSVLNVTVAGYNAATYVTQSVPSHAYPGQSLSISQTWKNTGSKTWTTAAGYKIGTQNPQDNGTWGAGRFAASGTVAPGAAPNYAWNVTAPASPGTYQFQTRWVQESVQWFGDLSTTVSVIVAKEAQSITFANPGDRIYGTTLTLNATASSGLAVAYAVSSSPAGIATLSAGKLTFTGVGQVTVTASQAGNTRWNPAGSVSQTFYVRPATQQITLTNPGDRNYSTHSVTISASANSGLPVTLSIASGPATIAGNAVTFTGVGDVAVLAVQTGNANYYAAPNASCTFRIHDDVPPAVPPNFSAVPITKTSLALNWDRSADQPAGTAAAYEVYRDGVPVATTGELSCHLEGLAELATYHLQVRARDAAGNLSGFADLTVQMPDMEPPSRPGELSIEVTAKTATTLTISWSASTDNVGVVGYRFMIEGNTAELHDGAASSFTFEDLESGHEYALNARAYDAAGNPSDWSVTISARTTDVVPPAAPPGLEVDGPSAGTSVKLKWLQPYDYVGVTGYDVVCRRKADGTLISSRTLTGSDTHTPPAPACDFTGLDSGVAYTFEVRAFDEAGLRSDPSALDVTTQDIVPPSPPGGLVASNNTTGTSFTVSWDASTDNVGVVFYEVRLGSLSQGTTTGRSFPISGLSEGRNYSITVLARDAAGLWSEPSAALPVRTPDVTPPTPPQDLAVSNISRSGFLFTWAPANDNIGVTGYEVECKLASATAYPEPGEETATNSAGVSRLTPGTTYTVRVRSLDGDGNKSTWSELPEAVTTTGTQDDGGTLPEDWPNGVDTTNPHVVGTTSGQLAVDPSGALTYTVPIWVTPGTAGMQPQLSLNYSSQAGAGLAGFGWSLSGVSTITRGPQTLAVDGRIHGVDYTADDRLYLDGQRLVVIDGAYWADGSEYRTEIDSLTKVVFHVASGGSPAWLEARTKAGLIVEYGHTADSAAEAGGLTAIATWAASKISDTVGNFMTFTYSDDPVHGEQLLTRIDYSGSRTTQAYASVRFTYKPRGDSFSGFRAGATFSRTQRLDRIVSYYGESAVRTYALHYLDRTTANARSLLDTITESGTDGASYPDLVFTYEAPTGGWQQQNAFTTPFTLAEATVNTGAGFMDLDGDGYPDAIHKRKDNATTDYNDAYLNTGSGWQATPDSGKDYRLPDVYTLSWKDRTDAGSRFVDLDGDGLVDVLFACKDKNSGNVVRYALRNTGTGWVDYTSTAALPAGCYIAGVDTADSGRRLVDINGDGLTDLVWSTSDADKGCYLNNSHGQIQSGGPFWVWAPQWTPPFPLMSEVTCGAQFCDVNGDGLPDLIQHGDNEAGIALNSSSGWGSSWIRRTGANSRAAVLAANPTLGRYIPPVWLGQDGTGWTATPIGSEIVDLNGDGLPDILMRNPQIGTPGAAQAWLNTGAGWVSSSAYAPPTAVDLCGRSDGTETDPTGALLIDLNADGLPDLAQWRADQSRVYYLNTGHGWAAANDSRLSGVDFSLPLPVVNGDLATPTGFQLVDLNGDGIADCIANPSEIYPVALNRARPSADRLTSVTNGFGVTASVSYALLTARDSNRQPLVYTKGSTASWPLVDVVAPLLVVKTVNYDDGVGGQYPVDYFYGGLRSDYRRGSAGFEWMRTTDGRTGIQSTTWFRQDFPFIGMPKASETKTAANGTTLAASTVDYTAKLLNDGKTRLPYASGTLQLSYELDGSFVSGTDTTTALDDYGNATTVTVSSLASDLDPDGFTKTTTSQFTNDPSTWILGRLTRSAVTAEAPGQDPLIRTSSFTYDPGTGLLLTETIEPDLPALRQITTYTYDAFGNKHTVTVSGVDVADRTSTTTYDSVGRFPESTENALGHTESYVYDQALGVVTSLTGPNDLTTSWTYDGFGAKKTESRADGTSSSIAAHWAGAGAPASALYFVETTATGTAPSLVFYDDFGRKLRSVGLNGDGGMVFQDTVYDDRGRAWATSVPYRSDAATVYWTRTTAYDLLDRPLTVETPRDLPGDPVATTSFRYQGLTNEVTDARGHVARTVKNSQGWVTSSVRDATGLATAVSYDYDPFGNLTTTTAAGVVTELTYDLRGRKTVMSDPDMGTWSYGYDAVGELVSQTDAKHQTTTLTYDALGRMLTRVEGSGTATTTWTYDTVARGSGAVWLGRPAKVTTTDGYEESYTYDPQGRPKTVTRKIDGTSYTITQTYDGSGRLERTSYPLHGFQTRNVYNAFGFLREVRRSDGAHDDLYWHADTYAVDGRVNGDTLGNGITGDRVYSASSGRLLGTGVGLAPFSDIQNLQYTYDAVGNVLKRINHAGVERRDETFTYDALDRLKTWALSGGATVSATYDLAGNILTKSDVGTYSYGTDPAVRPHAVSGVSGGPLGTQAYAYDANGNLTSGAGRTVTWTAFNQMKRIEQGGHFSEFGFGAAHERVKQTTDRDSTIYVGSLFELTKSTDGSSTEEKNYIFAPTGRIAVVKFGTDQDVAGTVNYFHTDGLGSVTVVTDGGATVVNRFAFDPWGKRLGVNLTTGAATTIASSQPGRMTRGFTDHEHLDDLGLIHMNGRIYDPVLGRFLSADPNVDGEYDSQGFNRYSYVGNNPLNATDPSGYFGLKDLIVTVVAVVVTAIVIVCTAGAGAPAAAGFWGQLGYGLAHMTLTAAIEAGAAGGFASGFSGSLLNGGSIGDAFKSGVIGAAWGAASAAVAYGVGQYFDGLYPSGTEGASMTNPLIEGGRALAHGVTQGGLAEVQGGQFRHGFYAAAFSSAAGSVSGHYILKGGGWHIAERTAISTVVGGTAAAIGGGKFANGAVGAAFQHLFNNEVASMFQGMTGYSSAAEAQAAAAMATSPRPLSESEKYAVEVFDAALSNMGLESAFSAGNYSESYEMTTSGVERSRGPVLSFGFSATAMATGKISFSNLDPNLTVSFTGGEGLAVGFDLSGRVTTRYLYWGKTELFSVKTFVPTDIKFKIGAGLGGEGKIETDASTSKSEKYSW